VYILVRINAERNKVRTFGYLSIFVLGCCSVMKMQFGGFVLILERHNCRLGGAEYGRSVIETATDKSSLRSARSCVLFDCYLLSDITHPSRILTGDVLTGNTIT
jgi:hypothetical protein